MDMINISYEQLELLCDIITNNTRYTKRELSLMLKEHGIYEYDDGTRNPEYSLDNKNEWLYINLANEIKQTQSWRNALEFIEYAFDPSRYSYSDPYAYESLHEIVNKALYQTKIQMLSTGKLVSKQPAATLALGEVDRRFNSLKMHMYNRAIHEQVRKLCNMESISDGYFELVYEAERALRLRVKRLIELQEDTIGNELYQAAFSLKNPYIYINSLETESEKNEHNGLMELLCAITNLVGGLPTHEPAIDWRTSEEEALDVLTMISLAHKYLDKYSKTPV